MNDYTVGDVASMARISVRTLHHYDAIGLLAPAHRTRSGYRTYDDAQIERLQAILTYRSLGLGLDEIGRIIDNVDEAANILRLAHRRVLDKIKHLEVIAATLRNTITDHAGEVTMSNEEKLSVFGDFDPHEYDQETKDLWGETDIYNEASRRTASYGHQDWERISFEADAIYERFAALMRAGKPFDSHEAAELVEQHRAHTSRWFYECPPRIHAALGQMYVADPRFTANIDRAGEGLAAYLSSAIGAAYTSLDGGGT